MIVIDARVLVAAAQQLDCTLVTTDGRLARGASRWCAVTVP